MYLFYDNDARLYFLDDEPDSTHGKKIGDLELSQDAEDFLEALSKLDGFTMTGDLTNCLEEIITKSIQLVNK